MRHRITDSVAEDVEDYLANNEEEDPKRDVPERPAILQGVRDKYDLHGQVDQKADAIDQVQHYEEANGVGWAQSSFAFECQDRYCA